MTEPSASASQTPVEKPQVQCIFPDNSKRTVKVEPTTTVANLLEQLVPLRSQQHCIEAYGTVYSDNQKIIDILKVNVIQTLLVSARERTYPVSRDIASSAREERIQRHANDMIQSHWESYYHCSANMFAYASRLRQTPPPPNLPTRAGPKSFADVAATNVPRPSTIANPAPSLPSIDRVQANLRQIIEDPGKFSGDIPVLMKEDETGGDCSLSHLRLIERLKSDNVTRAVQWELIAAYGVHTALCGVTLTGSLLLIDVGTLKEAYLISRLATKVITPRIGVRHPEPHKFHITVSDASSEIWFKVTSISYSH